MMPFSTFLAAQSARAHLYVFSTFCIVCGCGTHANEDTPGAGPLICTKVEVPAMTSSTAPAGEVTRSGVYDSSYEAWQAFDDTPSTLWLSETWQTPAWIAYEWADGPKRVESYVLTFRNGAQLATRAPKEFTLEGWNGSAWTVVDARHEQTNWVGSERREYAVSNPGSYFKYRLNVSDDNDDRDGVVVVSLGRIELIASDCSSGCGK